MSAFVRVRARRPALDQVGRQRERRAGEPDQRGLAELAHQRLDRLGHVRHVIRFERAQHVEIDLARIG